MKKMLAAALLALVACDGPTVDADGDGRITTAELCAAACACDGDACIADCMQNPGTSEMCREAQAQCVLDAKDADECVPNDPPSEESTLRSCARAACGG